jgi:hypothetical protein
VSTNRPFDQPVGLMERKGRKNKESKEGVNLAHTSQFVDMGSKRDKKKNDESRLLERARD